MFFIKSQYSFNVFCLPSNLTSRTSTLKLNSYVHNTLYEQSEVIMFLTPSARHFVYTYCFILHCMSVSIIYCNAVAAKRVDRLSSSSTSSFLAKRPNYVGVLKWRSFISECQLQQFAVHDCTREMGCFVRILTLEGERVEYTYPLCLVQCSISFVNL